MSESTAAVPMLLHCPECTERHIDVGEFATKRHHTHACQNCGHVWRPAVEATVGVRFLPGFKNEPERPEQAPSPVGLGGESREKLEQARTMLLQRVLTALPTSTDGTHEYASEAVDLLSEVLASEPVPVAAPTPEPWFNRALDEQRRELAARKTSAQSEPAEPVATQNDPKRAKIAELQEQSFQLMLRAVEESKCRIAELEAQLAEALPVLDELPRKGSDASPLAALRRILEEREDLRVRSVSLEKDRDGVLKQRDTAGAVADERGRELTRVPPVAPAPAPDAGEALRILRVMRERAEHGDLESERPKIECATGALGGERS